MWYQVADGLDLMTNDNSASDVRIMKSVSEHQRLAVPPACCLRRVESSSRSRRLRFLQGIMDIFLISYPADKISLLLCSSSQTFLGGVSKGNKRISDDKKKNEKKSNSDCASVNTRGMRTLLFISGIQQHKKLHFCVLAPAARTQTGGCEGKDE